MDPSERVFVRTTCIDADRKDIVHSKTDTHRISALCTQSALLTQTV